MIEKMGRKAIAAMEERKTLIAAGLNPDDSSKVKDHNKNAAAEKQAAFVKNFSRALVNITKHGLTETTVGDVVMHGLGRVDKEGEITAAGTKLRDALLKSIGTMLAVAKPA